MANDVPVAPKRNTNNSYLGKRMSASGSPKVRPKTKKEKVDEIAAVIDLCDTKSKTKTARSSKNSKLNSENGDLA